MSESSAYPNTTTTTTSSNNSYNNKVTIRYRFGIAPDHKIETDPSLMETVRAMNKIDGAVFLGTVLFPSFYAYRIQSNEIYIFRVINFFRIFFRCLLQIRFDNWFIRWCCLRVLSELFSFNGNFHYNPKISS